MGMLKLCSNCGAMHPFDAGQCQVGRGRTDTSTAKFRSQWSWRKMSEKVRERDHHLCQICMIDEYDTYLQYNSAKLEVHHIQPAEQYERLRLEPTNLITLCSMHHKQADAGKIPTWVMQALATLPRSYESVKVAISKGGHPPTLGNNSG